MLSVLVTERLMCSFMTASHVWSARCERSSDGGLVKPASISLATLSLRSFGNKDRAVATRNGFDDLC